MGEGGHCGYSAVRVAIVSRHASKHESLMWVAQQWRSDALWPWLRLVSRRIAEPLPGAAEKLHASPGAPAAVQEVQRPLFGLLERGPSKCAGKPEPPAGPPARPD